MIKKVTHPLADGGFRLDAEMQHYTLTKYQDASPATRQVYDDLMRTTGEVVLQTWISYQNHKFISVDKQANNDIIHFVEFGETNRLSG